MNTVSYKHCIVFLFSFSLGHIGEASGEAQKLCLLHLLQRKKDSNPTGGKPLLVDLDKSSLSPILALALLFSA